MHLGQLAVHELAPLLPHLAHLGPTASATAQASPAQAPLAKLPAPQLASLLAVALGKGWHLASLHKLCVLENMISVDFETELMFVDFGDFIQIGYFCS